MSTSDPAGQPPGEEELRAAYEAEIKRIRVENLLLEQVVTLINMGMRRTGLTPGTEDERDPEQVRLAIEAIRALIGIVEPLAGGQAGAIRDALSQLQLAYVRIGGQPGSATAPPGAPAPGAPGASAAGSQTPGGSGTPSPPGAPAQPGAAPPGPGEGGAGPAQRSGRLWIPGQ